mgnify:CR=1 FL=1
MGGNKFRVKVVLMTALVFSTVFSGCFEEEREQLEEILVPPININHPSVLPDWNNGEYHDYYETMNMLQEFQIDYPDLVNVFSIGESILGRDICCIRITNEKNNDEKYSCLIDGCIHGCEWEAGEACLYLAEYLLINQGRNGSISSLLNKSEIYIIPLVNPDGRQVDSRFNDNGIDLNRNFDVDFGRIRGSSMPLGVLFGQIEIPYRMFPRLHNWFSWFPPFLTNSGRRPFSEPETQALRNTMKNLENNKFSFYLNCHTAVHTFNSPWICFKPPFEITSQENKVNSAVIDWVVDNSEYENGKLHFEGLYYKASGSAMDWCFKEYHIPSFSFEILSTDYEPGAGGGRHDHLVHWMKTTLPVFMYLVVNIENLHNWVTPDIQPLLPEGVPPEPLQ